MELKSCRVTVRDMDGVAHTVEVTASTLYEAVAQALLSRAEGVGSAASKPAPFA